ncbi:MAG: GNAT family N-acetyltransferase [Ruminococcus flavefaciens]|nr:GNAT family N-acetyltransferase [Ruminococcus flavefaciens]
MNITRQQYLSNPCRESSLPYWKAVRMDVPENMLIQHDRHFCGECFTDYLDEPYFRLYHDLQMLRAAILPDGFRLREAAPAEYAAHINQCYAGVSITEAEIKSYFQRSVYSAALWIAVQECKSQKIVATGIAELDEQVGEGILEWIQVSPAYRGLGLGTYVVTELLTRIAQKAQFATVSGQINNPSKPERLYRKCGFQGNDIWHVLRKRN